MDHSLPGIVWALTRLQIQIEAVITVLDALHPGFRQQVGQEIARGRDQGRLGAIGAETKREIEDASDWMWLKGEGIDPEPPKP